MSTTNPSTMLAQAVEAFKGRDRIATATLLHRLIAMKPDLGASWGAVSRLANTIGEVSIAAEAARRHAALDPRDAAARLAHGQILAQNGRIRQAADIGEALTRDQPNNPAAWHFAGSCHAQIGQDALAVSDLRRAIALSPGAVGQAWPWLALSGAKTFTHDDPDIAAMQTILARLNDTPADIEARGALLYALGKAYDDCDEPDRAFAAYSAGAAIVDATRKSATAQTDAFVDDLTRNFTRDLLDRLPASTVDSDRPIFVFGLPRSGTTLVEQILASHDDVSDGAEINLFQVAAMPIRGFTPAAIEAFARANPDGLTQIGQDYLHLLEERFGPRPERGGRVIDKTLNQSRYLGLIHAALPRARFIWMQREPGGIAWSCFRTRFARSVDWSWSLTNIAHYFRSEDRLRAHWTEVLGDAILTVPYEDLVNDPEPWIARILDHVGLPRQDGLKDFHKTDRAVTTASFAQVRKPLYTTSREAWRKYETHLKPFFEAYSA